VAITLFVAGPQAGSIDDDGDGNPDVPIVVLAPGLTGEGPHRTYLNDLTRKVPSAVAQDFVASHFPCSGMGNSHLSARNSRFVLRFSCLLRC